MKIFIIIVIVNSFLLFLSADSTPFYITSYPRIDELILNLLDANNQIVINSFKNMDITAVESLCKSAISAPLFLSTKTTHRIATYANFIHENEIKRRRILFLNTENKQMLVDAFNCKNKREKYLVYISSDFTTGNRYFVYFINHEKLEDPRRGVVAGIMEKQEADVSVVDNQVFYTQKVNKNSDIVEGNEAVFNFLQNVDKGQALRLCSLAYSHILNETKAPSIYYKVDLIFLKDYRKDKFVLWLHKNADELEEDENVYIQFRKSFCCNVKWGNNSDIFCLMPDREDQKSAYFLWNMVDNFFTLVMYFKNALLLEDN